MSEYISALGTLLNKHYPLLKTIIEISPKRFDDLIQHDGERYDERNESFILTHHANRNALIIEIICLYSDSLKITIENAGSLSENKCIDSLLNEIKIYFYNEILQQQKLMFQRISDNTWHLASGLSHEIITQHVVDGALKTIPFSDAVIFRIYDERKSLLIPKALSGFNNNYYDYSVSTRESVSGRVFESRKSVILNSREAILASFTHESAIRESVMENNPIANSLICVPVQDKHICYGTLTLLSFSHHSIFNSLAVSLLETFASQVALAWKNAKIHDEKISTLNEIDTLRKQLERQNEVLKSNVEFYNEMIKLSIKNNEIVSFVDAVMQKINLSAAYLDILGNSYQSTMKLPFTWDEISSHDNRNGYCEDIFTVEEYAIYPLRHDQVCVGYFILNQESIMDYTQMMLSRLGDFIVMEIMRKASGLRLEHKKKALLIDELSSHGINSDIEKKLASHGFLVQNFIMCLRIDVAFSDEEEMLAFITLNKIKVLLARRNFFSFYDDESMVIYISDLHSLKIKELCDKIAKSLPLGAIKNAGASRILRRDEFRLAFQQASTALKVLTIRKQTGLLRFHDSGMERMFIHHAKEEIHQFIFDVLSPILDNSEKSESLLMTLNSYINHRCSVHHAAKELNIHVNTLYQRIRKIEQLTHYQLSSADDFLMVSLACHMNRLYL